MKRIILILTVIFTASCHHKMDPWPADGDRVDVAMYVRSSRLSGITTPPSLYQLFVYDKQNQTTKRYQVSPDKNNNSLLHLPLFPGNYTGFCITNAEPDEYWEYSDNKSPGEIFLKAQKTKNGQEEANDHLLGQCDFEVKEGETNPAIFTLYRKVGMLKILIENIPSWLTDLRINLSNLPTKMSLTGDYSSNTYTLSKNVSLPDETGFSETHILFFPPLTNSLLTLSSESEAFTTAGHAITSLQANQITEIKATFKNPGSATVDFTTTLVDWEEEVIHENDWELEMPAGPCTGTSNGNNLVHNGSFEEGVTDGLPDGWKFDSGGETKSATQVTAPVEEGVHAIRLEGKTYLYQDIAISGGQCYQLNMYVNAPSNNVKWRYWCTWIAGSTNLPSDAIHSASFQYQTNGYTDVFNNQIFRAPENATKLRMEIRSYIPSEISESLYVDNVRVEAVD